MGSLPRLEALRFFVATASHLSMRTAAEELHVTPGAVSQRIRELEQELQRRVFRRVGRGLALTPEGEVLYAAATSAFHQLQAAVDIIRNSPIRDVLDVTVGPYMGARWLSRRLSRFWEAHPEIELRLHHPREGTAHRPAEQ